MKYVLQNLTQHLTVVVGRFWIWSLQCASSCQATLHAHASLHVWAGSMLLNSQSSLSSPKHDDRHLIFLFFLRPCFSLLVDHTCLCISTRSRHSAAPLSVQESVAVFWLMHALWCPSEAGTPCHVPTFSCAACTTREKWQKPTLAWTSKKHLQLSPCAS